MDSKEILENDELIAKFMQLEKSTLTIDGHILYFIDGTHTNSRYNSSYDWLMSVIEKIESLGCIIEISFSLVTICRICVIGKKNERVTNFINTGNNSIEVIYKIVVEYIKWYNKRSVD